MNINYFGILPANVRYDKKLKPMEKILYTELTALANIKGYCFSKNSYFAELYEVDKATVSRWISNLEKQGYIKSVIVYKNGTKEVLERRIYINEKNILTMGKELFLDDENGEVVDKKINTYGQKNQYPLDEKIIDPLIKKSIPIDKKVKDNNTSINNTSNNNTSINIYTSTFEKIDKVSSDLFFKKWNLLAEENGLAKVFSFSSERKSRVKSLISEHGEYIDKVFSNIAKSPFLLGENKQGWKITFDWIIKKSNFIKVLEGQYSKNEKKEYKQEESYYPQVTAEGLKKYFMEG